MARSLSIDEYGHLKVKMVMNKAEGSILSPYQRRINATGRQLGRL